MTFRFSYSSILLLLLSIINVLTGMLAAMVMMSDDFLNAFYEAKGHIVTGSMDEFFVTWILHPASGLVYLMVVIWLAVYQKKYLVLPYRYVGNIFLMMVSGGIVLKAVLLLTQ